LSLNDALVRPNAQNTLDYRVGITCLNVSLTQNWVETAAHIGAQLVLALIAPNGGMCEVLIVVTWNARSEKRSERDITIGQIISDVECEILKGRVVLSIVHWQLMRFASVKSGRHIWKSYFDSKVIGERVIALQDYGVGEDVARIAWDALFEYMVAHKNILVAHRHRAATLREHPGLGQKRGRTSKNEREQKAQPYSKSV
jgi:hypothetical protein